MSPGVVLAALGLFLLPGGFLRAQNSLPGEKPPDPGYTLHVYEDLVQIPALVLTRSETSERGLLAQDFTLQLDGGPAFHPRHIHVQGDEPIELGILLDVSGSKSKELLQAMDAALAGLKIGTLTSHDRVAVYAFDCNLIGSTASNAAVPSTLRASTNAVLKAPQLHRAADGVSRCQRRISIQGAVGVVVGGLHQRPGQRAMVVISSDDEPVASWEAVRALASGYGVAVFALRPFLLTNSWRGGETDMVGNASLDGPFSPLDLFCQGTGGFGLIADKSSLTEQFERMVAYLRNRYILEFSRPSNGTAGRHRIEVTVDKRRDMVLTSGVTFPVRDKTLLNDPSTVPSDSTRSPVQGDRLKPESSH